MTREDFIRSKQEGERYGKRFPWWIFACMWFAGTAWTIYLLVLLLLYWSTEARTPILVELCVCVLLIAALPFFDRLWKERMTKLGLQCPSCHAWLISAKGEAVLQTGRCEDCGTQLIEEPNKASDATSEPAPSAGPSSHQG